MATEAIQHFHFSVEQVLMCKVVPQSALEAIKFSKFLAKQVPVRKVVEAIVTFLTQLMLVALEALTLFRSPVLQVLARKVMALDVAPLVY